MANVERREEVWQHYFHSLAKSTRVCTEPQIHYTCCCPSTAEAHWLSRTFLNSFLRISPLSYIHLEQEIWGQTTANKNIMLSYILILTMLCFQQAVGQFPVRPFTDAPIELLSNLLCVHLFIIHTCIFHMHYDSWHFKRVWMEKCIDELIKKSMFFFSNWWVHFLCCIIGINFFMCLNSLVT